MVGVTRMPPRNGAVKTGIDRLIEEQFAPLAGKRVGLITNHTGLTRTAERTIDVLNHAQGVQLVAIFSPGTLIAPAFGGINLEDISAPRCFDIEERLQKEVDIPVFHDDQHGTSVVVLAALLNALRVVNKRLRDLKIVVSGIGASGVACTKILLAMGARNIVGLDTRGALYRGRRPGVVQA